MTGPQTRLWQRAGRREEQDDGLLAQDVREVVVVHVVGRDPRVDLGDVGDLADGQRVDGRGRLANLRRRVLADRVWGRQQAVLVGVAGLDQGAERPGTGLVQRDVADVGDLGRAWIIGGGLGAEGGLGGEVLDPGREGADRGPARALAGRGVDAPPARR